MNEIDISLIDWSRAQFALTAIYHWIFVPLTLGLSFIVAIMHTFYYKTGNKEWKVITKFWMKIFGINFAIGVATGIILSTMLLRSKSWLSLDLICGVLDLLCASNAIDLICIILSSTSRKE